MWPNPHGSHKLSHVPAHGIIPLSQNEKCWSQTCRLLLVELSPAEAPQWGAADAEIKVPSGENTELKSLT